MKSRLRRTAGTAGFAAVMCLGLAGCGSGSDGMRSQDVTGRVQWGGGGTGRAVVKVTLRDVSVADGASPLIDQRILRDVAFENGQAAFSLSFAGAPTEPGRSYAVFAEIDANGDGMVGEGDYVTESLNYVRPSDEITVVATRLEACGPEAQGYCATGPGRPLTGEATP